MGGGGDGVIQTVHEHLSPWLNTSFTNEQVLKFDLFNHIVEVVA